MIKSNIEAEQNTLGCYLLGYPIGHGINEDVFSTKAHKNTFKIINDLRLMGVTTDICVTVSEAEKQGTLEDCGGSAAIAALTNSAIPANLKYYELEIKVGYQRRKLWESVTHAKESLEKGESPEAVHSKLLDIAVKNQVQNRADTGILFRDLIEKEFPVEDWLIEGLITSGLTVLTGAAKIGKSWTALQLVTALDRGGYFLGTLKAKQCDSLYLALEDTPRRIQKRLQKQGCTTFNGSRLETKKMSIAGLKVFLKANPQFRVVVIDTLQKMLGLSDMNDYSQAVNGMSALKEIADDLGIAVIVIHHNRKSSDLDSDHMESALGSTGLNATADCTITMRRKRGAAEATMFVSGRDVEDTTYTLLWDKDCCSWAITGSGALKPALPEAQQQIVDFLGSEDRVWTTREIVESTGKTNQAVSNLLSRMKDAGLIKNPERGQWRTKSEYTNTHVYRESVNVYSENKPKTLDNTEYTNSLSLREGEYVNLRTDAAGASQDQDRPLPEIPPGCSDAYDFAYNDYLNKGYTPEEAGREARQAIKDFLAQIGPESSQEPELDDLPPHYKKRLDYLCLKYKDAGIPDYRAKAMSEIRQHMEMMSA
ncbi:MAG: AAA family ATPase [Treponema sp.]|jgi:hypothetical protein|nr:AAA family ATPase [Treponema sp.]